MKSRYMIITNIDENKQFYYKHSIDTQNHEMLLLMLNFCLIKIFIICQSRLNLTLLFFKIQLLQPWKLTYRMFIKEELKKFVDSVTAQEQPECSCLVAGMELYILFIK